MSDLKLYLLGPPRLERDGVQLSFDTRRNVALVAYLAVTGRSQSRETLIALLWPEFEPSRARAILRRNLSVLRRTLGGEWLVVDREAIGTDPEAGLWLDIDQFHSLVSAWQVHGHAQSDLCPDCLTALADAVELYRGDFLAGFGVGDSVDFDEWLFFQAESLRRELASALERLARGHSARRAYGEAIHYARRRLSLDPLCEAAHRHLMRLYAWAGQRTAALRQYEECARILQAELGVSPAQSTTDLYDDIRSARTGDAPLAQRRHNLPSQLTPFIGREAKLAEIRERLTDPGCRLLTLVGPGGSGKTRLAIEAALSLASLDAAADGIPSAAERDPYVHGVFLVPLDPVQSVEAMVPTIAQAVGFPLYAAPQGESAVEPQQQLLDYLRGKRLLLILDNLEHLLPGPQGAASLVAEMLRCAPTLRILATSRARLNIQGEHLLPVTGLSLPESPTSAAEAGRFGAIALFLDAARRLRPGFGVTDDNLADVVRICELVEGMPLGVLLAASWIQALSPAAIAAQIAQGIDFLESDLCDVPERHHSMRAVFDHSWKLLSQREREVFQALSVFRGGFALEAAREVAGASPRELRALVDKSLLHRSPSDRCGTHELVRQYAEEKLELSPAVKEAVHDRHCAHYASAVRQGALDLRGARQQEALGQMDLEVGNLRAAWAWAVEREKWAWFDQAIDGLCLYWARRGHYQEGEALCRLATEKLQAWPHAGERRIWAKTLAWQGVFSRETGHMEVAGRLLQEAQALLQALEPVAPSLSQDIRAEKAFVMMSLGEVTYSVDRRQATGLYEESLALYRAVGDLWGAACVLDALGWVALNLSAYGEARRSSEESLALRRALGDRWGVASSLRLLGRILHSLGEYEEAERLLRESISILEEIGDRVGVARGLNILGPVLQWSGQFREAQALLEKSWRICSELGYRVGQVDACMFLATMKAHMGQYESSRPMLEEALTLAREGDYWWGVSHSLMLLGAWALVEQDYEQAWRICQESVASYRQVGDVETPGFPEGFAAVAALRLGQPSLARQYLRDGLQSAVAANTFEALVYALAALALLLIDQGQTARAIDLYALASRHPVLAASCFFQDVYGQYVAAAAETLPPEVVAAAKERGRARDLHRTAAEILAELER